MEDYFWVEGLGACLKNTKVKDYIAKKNLLAMYLEDQLYPF